MYIYIHGKNSTKENCINKEGNENRLSNVKPEKSLGIVYLDISDGQILFYCQTLKHRKEIGIGCSLFDFASIE